MERYVEIKKRIDARLKELGLSQKEAADKVGKYEKFFSQFISNGREDPRISSLEAIARALDTTIDWVWNGDQRDLANQPPDEARDLLTGYLVIASFLALSEIYDDPQKIMSTTSLDERSLALGRSFRSGAQYLSKFHSEDAVERLRFLQGLMSGRMDLHRDELSSTNNSSKPQ